MAIVSQPVRSLEVGGAGCALIYSWLSCQGWFLRNNAYKHVFLDTSGEIK